MENIRDFHYRAPRFTVDFRFLALAGSDQVRYGRCYEISTQGLVAWLSEPLDVETRATLILTLPGDSEQMAIAATVTRRFGSDHAFTFADSSAGDRAHLHQYLLAQGPGL